MLEKTAEVRAGKSRDRRVDRSRAKVLAAARMLLVHNGVAAFTIESVIATTGVARSTIYRHWPTRGELVADAIAALGKAVPVPDTGSVRGDLLDFFLSRTRIIEDDSSDNRMLSVPGLMEAARRDPSLSAVVTHTATGSHRSVQDILRRGQARGEVAANLDLDIAADLLLGALYMRRGYLSLPMTDDYVTDMVDTALAGVVLARA